MKVRLKVIISILAYVGIVITVLNNSFSEGFKIGEGLNMFRYFTIQSNLIVGSYFSMSLINSVKDNKLFKKMLGGVTVYITITCLVFVVFLEARYEHTGIGHLSNLIVHYIVPVLTIVFLTIYRRDYSFEAKDIGKWVVYPLSYIVFVQIFGRVTGDYIYPFFEVDNIGVIGLIKSVVLLVLFFMFLSFLTMKIVSKKELTKHS